jgi:Restriction endonuclease
MQFDQVKRRDYRGADAAILPALARRPDRFIASCNSWDDFWEQTKRLASDADKGAAFERLIQLYLQTTPEYRTELQHVWLLREVPPDICRLINLPSHDEGVDLIARTRRGEYWAIQAKFRSRDQPLNRRELGTFSSLAFNTCNNIALAVVAHTSTKPISKRHLMRNTVEDWSRPLAISRSGRSERLEVNRCKNQGSTRATRGQKPKATPARGRYRRSGPFYQRRCSTRSSTNALRHRQKPYGVLDR